MSTPQVDKIRSLHKLKRDLEPFRTAIVGAYGVLTWEKQYYAAIVFGGISFIYLVLWYLDLSFITLASLLVLFGIIVDFIFPTLSRLFLSNAEWNGDHEAKFDEVCSQICSIKTSLSNWYDYMFNETKSTVFVIIISICLLTLAWIGAIINNLLLMYFATVLVAIWPGLQNKDVFKAVTEKASKLINEKIQGGKKKLQ